MYTLFFYKNQSILFEAGCSWFIFIFEAEMFLSCSYFPDWTLQCYKDDVRLSAIKAHYFISFILFPSSRAHRQPLGGILKKIGSATVLKPVKTFLRRRNLRKLAKFSRTPFFAGDFRQLLLFTLPYLHLLPYNYLHLLICP